MKKQFNKSLVLNKETVTNLENKDMTTVKGGATFYCPSFDVFCPTSPCKDTDLC